jgi:hypothetical protein
LVRYPGLQELGASSAEVLAAIAEAEKARELSLEGKKAEAAASFREATLALQRI